jgi:V8-like Glu-specific endopeptidase
MSLRVVLPVAVIAIGVGCAPPQAHDPAIAAVRAPVVYGRDDRVEAERWADTPFAAAAIGRAVALFPAQPVQPRDDDAGAEMVRTPTTARQRFDLCADERFADQPSLGDCSGVLIAADVVLTAGHCFEAADGCDRYRYGLDFVHADDDAGASDASALGCSELVAREVGQLADGSAIDYALVRLEHPVGGRDADPPLRALPVDPGEHLTSVGFPAGLPLKIDVNAEAVIGDRTGFRLTTDAYHGSSGSAVYDDDGALVGVLTGGQPDFERDLALKCYRSRVIDAGSAAISERAMYASIALGRACHQRPELGVCPPPPAGSETAEPPPIENPMIADPVITAPTVQAPGIDVPTIEENPTPSAAATKPVPAAVDADGDRGRDAGVTATLHDAADSREPDGHTHTPDQASSSRAGCSATAGAHSAAPWLALSTCWLGLSARRRRRSSRGLRAAPRDHRC